MIKMWPLVLILCAHSLMLLAASDTGQHRVLFEQLIEESGLQFSHPPDFTDITLESNPVLHYEHAIRHDSGVLEIRYIIRPLERLSIDYNDPHNAVPEPNHIFPLLFEALINELSRGGNTPNKEYPLSQAQELFNAGWASASVFDVNPKFSNSYNQALLIGIHKDEQADAYTVFLFNEYSEAKNIIKSSLSTLYFSH